MATYQGNKGQSYATIEPALGKGGEGSVYSIQGRADLVAKVFTDSFRTEKKKRKLLVMLAKPITSSAVAWPQDVIFENGKFVGYVMRKLNRPKDLNEIYDPSGPLKSLKLRPRVLMAQNLCAAIYAVHQAGQVCGDLNPKNIQVEPDYRVTLVDTDSYHLTGTDGKLFSCSVGREEYLPAEIQKKLKIGHTLDTAPQPTFSRESDLFALAIHIFALVMNGCHPFSTAVSPIAIKKQPSITNPQPQENIASGSSPFFVSKPGLTIPTYAPQITVLPKAIQDLFVKAFCDGHVTPGARPSSKEWYDALGQWLKTISDSSPALAPATPAVMPAPTLTYTPAPYTPPVIQPAVPASSHSSLSSKSTVKAFLLCLFLGPFGGHNFYVGKIGLGVLFLFTGGFLGIGSLVDMFRIAYGHFYDEDGYALAPSKGCKIYCWINLLLTLAFITIGIISEYG